MLPLYRTLYNKDAPRLSSETKVDILPVARWFGEELFTYIRVFGSYVSPHVLPLYVLDKLVAREITYQTCGQGGMTKDLKDKKKGIWPQFPIKCGTFSLFDIGHAFREIENVTCLRLFKFSRRLFDQNDIVKNFTNAIKVREFVAEQDLFDDMFQARNSFKEVLNSAKEQLSPKYFQEFKLYRERRLIPIPLDNLRLEPAREKTPSVSLNDSSNTGKSKSKSDRDSEHCNTSKEKEDKMEESIKNSAQPKELAQQQILTPQ